MAIDKRITTIRDGTRAAPRAPFERPLPDEAACLDWLKNVRYPQGIVCQNPVCARSGQLTKHHRVVSRRSYCCARCGHHIHPAAGTIFRKSSTPLRLWFYAIYLMASTDFAIPARELQRELQVTYKTAWRMSAQIRVLFDGEPEFGRTIAAFIQTHLSHGPRAEMLGRDRSSPPRASRAGA